MERVFNFAPGPSMLPLPVLEQIQKELLCYGSTGMSVMEMSHRSKMYLDIFNQTVADLREVMAIPDHYKGASSAGRRDRHVRGRRHEPDGRRPCRLRRFRQLRAQRAGRGAEIRRGQRRRFLPRGKLHPYSGLYALPGCEIRPHHDQQHDLRHALGSHSRHGRRTAGRGHVFQHPQRGLRRGGKFRRDLRGRAEKTSRLRAWSS